MSVPAALAPFYFPIDQLPPVLRVPTLEEVRGGETAFEVTIRPPGSKSLTNRALVLAALARGESVLRHALVDADDAKQMLGAIRMLGADAQVEGDTIRVTGVDGRWRVPATGVVLNLNNAGTAVRFLAGASLLSPGPVTIDGNARMRERPIAELGELLVSCGCAVEYLGKHGCPPVRITAGTQPVPRSLHVGPMQSSQFVSGLLLAASWLEHGLTLTMDGPATSASYIAMTVGLLSKLGASVQTSADDRIIRVHPPAGGSGLGGFQCDVEPDASGATYFWAAAAMVPGARITVLGLDGESLQGDSDFPVLLRRMGARVMEKRGVDASIRVVGPATLEPVLADMSDMPDAAMTLGAAACFASGDSVLRGLGTLRVKETDRIAALTRELTKVGVSVTQAAGDPNALTIAPPRGGLDCSFDAPAVEFDTYDDHRMAMSLALIGLRRPNVFIRNPACVAKTYSTFWSEFARLYTDARAAP